MGPLGMGRGRELPPLPAQPKSSKPLSPELTIPMHEACMSLWVTSTGCSNDQNQPAFNYYSICM